MALAEDTATLLREPLDVEVAAHAALRALRDDDRPFALIGAWAGGGAILGSAPLRVARPGEDVLARLDDLPPVAGGGAAEAVGGGWVGHLGFELRHAVERGHPPPPRPVPLPAGTVAFYDHVLRLDPAGRWWFEALWTPERAAALERRQAELAVRLAAPPAARPFATSGWRWMPSLAGHALAVEACRERIAAGDLFQANLCVRLDGRLEGAPLDLFAAAVAALPTDRAAFVSGPWGALASLSPELFLARRKRTVRSAPIKGTRPWDRREELARGVRDSDLVRAAFPPGSVTGAPKLAALDVIAELESTGREAYTGAIGLASPLSGLELSVAIRTFEMAGDHIWLGVGGGVVADSEGAAEAREAAAKAAPLLTAIGAALPEATAAPSLRVARRGPRPVPRPDPAAGLYETLLVEDGRPLHLADHLARLAASLRVLYGRPLPPGLRERIAAEAAAAGPGRRRLRVDVTPALDVTVVTGPPPGGGVVVLRPVVLPGGLGAHKWRDRRLLEAHEADDPATMPLLLDADGLVLEASRASVVAAATDGGLHTPPADGRILPGTTRARLAAAERALTLADLRAAPRLYVASALRGCQAATLAG